MTRSLNAPNPDRNEHNVHAINGLAKPFMVKLGMQFGYARVRAACFVWLVGLSCALAQDVCTNDQPVEISAIIEPDAMSGLPAPRSRCDPGIWIVRFR